MNNGKLVMGATVGYYTANVARFLDKKGNKSLIQMQPETDKDGLINKLTFSFVGIGSNSGMLKELVYDFHHITINGKPLFNEKKAQKKNLKQQL